MNLIIETDIGHDPDDLFALCYLVAAGVNIRCITIVPGDPDQVAIVNLLCKELGLNIPIGVSKLNREKLSSGGVHHELLEKYGHSFHGSYDGLGSEIIADTLKSYPDAEFFIIGPCTNVGKFLVENSNVQIKRATMQGGFLSYDLHDHPTLRLEQFEGKTWVPTFNLNGDRNAGQVFLAADIQDRRMVGKNVCHTVLFNRNILESLNPINRASQLFQETAEMYLTKHPEKKFHDPAAAVCHLHPEIAHWVRGKTTKIEGGWGTHLDDSGDHIAAGLNYENFWKYIKEFK